MLFKQLFFAWSFVLLISAPTAAEIGGDNRRGADLYEFKGCSACHGLDGLAVDPNAPHLAGQQRTYLFNQLVNFRSDRATARLGEKVSERHHLGMAALATRFRDSDIADIAAYLSDLPCSPGAGVVPPTRPAVATKCEFCHGIQGHSPFAAIPIITGQKQDYIARQLREFRNSAADFWGENIRSNRFVLAAKMDLTNAEIVAAARYFSQLSCR